MRTQSMVTRLHLKSASLEGNGDDDIVVQSAWGFVSSDFRIASDAAPRQLALDRRHSGFGRKAWPCFALAHTQRVCPRDVGVTAKTVHEWYKYIRTLRRRSDIGTLTQADIRVMRRKVADRALRLMPLGPAARIRLTEMAWSERRLRFAAWQKSALARSAPLGVKKGRKRKTLHLSARARPVQ